jgi:hypothetical protein
MDVKETYRELTDRWTHTTGAERAAVQEELDAFFDSLTEADKPLLHEAVDEQLERTHRLMADIRQLKQEIEVRKQLEQVLPFISLSAFARTYFSKSASWLHQRINGYMVHGRAATFSSTELQTLSHALHDVGEKLLTASGRVLS